MGDNTSQLYRRSILQAAGLAGAIGIAGTRRISAKDRAPLERRIVGVEGKRADVATDAADEVYRVLKFGSIGQAVSGWFSDEAQKKLEKDPNVRYIEENDVWEARDHTVDENEGNPYEEQVLPWGIDRVDADVAHHQGETAAGAEITIIDSGIDPSHETLEANVAGGRAWAECEGDCEADWDDDNGHGTHVAGTAGAVNNDVGVVGVATEADMYAAKVLDGDGRGTVDDIAAAIEWSADEGHDVANLSLGGPSGSDTVEDAVQYAYGEGVLLVAAAGNDGPDEDSVNYPAAYPEVMAISAIDEDDDIATFSSRGEEIELAAPGVRILSSVPDDEYAESNGTSMAAPHVSGAGAHLMDPQTGMENEEARERLRVTAEDLNLDDTEQGEGLVDVAAALAIEDTDRELRDC